MTPRRRARQVCFGVAAIGFVVAHASPSPAGTRASDELVARIDSLRTEARYAEALAEATELRDFAMAHQDSFFAYEIEDAARRVATLELASALAPDAQRELAGADRTLSLMQEAVLARDAERALELARRQLEIRRRYLGEEHPEVASALENVATGVGKVGQLAEAEELFRRAIAIRESTQSREHPDIAMSLGELAANLALQGKPALAEPLARRAVEIERRYLPATDEGFARTTQLLAYILFQRAEFAGSERLYREALTVTRRLHGDEYPGIGTILAALGAIRLTRGDCTGAEPLMREAAELLGKEFGTDHPNYAVGLANLAATFSQRGDFAAAEPLQREALAIARRAYGDARAKLTMIVNNLAYTVAQRGDLAAAELLYREAIEIEARAAREHGEPRDGAAQANLAQLLKDRGRPEEAEAFVRKALALGREGQRPRLVAGRLTNLGQILVERGELDEAIATYHEGLDLFTEIYGSEHPSIALVQSSLATALRDQGHLAEAERRYREALALRVKVDGENDGATANVMVLLALDLRAQDRVAEAESLLARAANAYERARLRAGTGLARSTFQASPYPLLAEARLASGRAASAWPAMERALGRSLADLLFATHARTLPPADAAEGDSLRTALGDLERRVAVLVREASQDPSDEARDRATQAQAALLETQARWSVYEQRVIAEFPVSQGQAYPLARVQAVLDSVTALVGWLDVDLLDRRERWSYVIRSEGEVRWRKLTARASADDPIARHREMLAAGWFLDPSESGPDDLWSDRVGPIEPDLVDIRRLVVVPSGAMLGVPLESVRGPDGRYLGDRFQISYAPSATTLTWLTENPAPGHERSALLLGDPPFRPEHSTGDVMLAAADEKIGAGTFRGAMAGNREAVGNLPRLPGTLAEVRTLSGVFPSARLLAGEDASEQALVALSESGELNRFSVIHIATHAIPDGDQPERSALILSQVGLPDALESIRSGERVYDGIVTAGEIAREWNLDAELVALSACETALGKEVAGEGYVGLAHAFFQAGARSVLVGLWKVEDTATALLMHRFYDRWIREGLSKTEALREAKSWLRSLSPEQIDHECETLGLSLRSAVRGPSGGPRGTRAPGDAPFANPYYWAPFILIGDPD